MAGGPAGHAAGLGSRKRKADLGSWGQDIPLVESFDLSTGGGPPAPFPGDRGAHGWPWLRMEQSRACPCGAQGRSHRGLPRPHPRESPGLKATVNLGVLSSFLLVVRL